MVHSRKPFGARRALGQNFLVDQSFIGRIIEAFNPRAEETVIEIGPGRGALTSALIGQVGRLIAIEFDIDLAEKLRERFAGREDLTLIKADALDMDFCREIGSATSARVISNLPYYISTPILRRLIEQRSCIPEAVLMLQREVVERITAPPGSPKRGFLSVLIEAYCDTEDLFDVPPGAFRPSPKVWSSVIRVRFHGQPRVDVREEQALFALVGAGFAQKRKTIFNNLRNTPLRMKERLRRAGGPGKLLEISGIDRERRAETLSVGEWARLERAIEAGVLANSMSDYTPETSAK
jgi:16S rRNA (adenine1518-N6/adenine1519-N6)-dimethyltransferase